MDLQDGVRPLRVDEATGQRHVKGPDEPVGVRVSRGLWAGSRGGQQGVEELYTTRLAHVRLAHQLQALAPLARVDALASDLGPGGG
jgi:hypothetical protein